MAENKPIFGRITCPYCHTAEGMRITADKHGAPFGYCDEGGCSGQLRIGGNAARVKRFFDKYPQIAAAMRGDETPTTTPAADNQKQTPTPSEKTDAEGNKFSFFDKG